MATRKDGSLFTRCGISASPHSRENASSGPGAPREKVLFQRQSDITSLLLVMMFAASALLTIRVQLSSKMFRLAISRAPIAVRALRSTRLINHAVARPLAAPTYLRWKSTAPTVDKLVDWNGPKLSYEQVKPRTEQPSPVSQYRASNAPLMNKLALRMRI